MARATTDDDARTGQEAITLDQACRLVDRVVGCRGRGVSRGRLADSCIHELGGFQYLMFEYADTRQLR